MALFPYFPRLWTTDGVRGMGVAGLRSFCLFTCFIRLRTYWKYSRTIAGRWKMPFFFFFWGCGGALLLHGSKRTFWDNNPFTKNIAPATVWCKCVSVACWVPTLLHNRWRFLRSANADVTPKLKLFMGDSGLFVCLLAGWLVGFWDGTGVHFNISNFAVVWSGCVHMTWCLVWRRKKKKNTNDIF